MAERTIDIQSRIIGLTSVRSNRLDRSSYRLQNNKVIMFRYSKPYTRGNLLDYWFGLPKEKFESYPVEKLFILFVCASDNQVLIIPATYLSDLLRDVSTAIDNHWKLHIFKHQNIFEISVTGKPNENVSEYLNRYELLSEEEVREVLPSGEQREVQVAPEVAV